MKAKLAAIRATTTKAIIKVRCVKCGLPGLMDQKPGHLCCSCLGTLVESRVNNK